MDEKTFYLDVVKFWEHRSSMPNFCWENLHDLNELTVLKYLKEGDSVLDIGCGDGEIAKRIAPISSYVECIDICSVFEHSLPNVNFIQTDLRQYVPSENKFDLIIMFGVTQYLCDKDVLNLYKKLKSQLKNGGTLLIKHQITTLKNDKIIDDFSIKLNCKYASILRTKHNDMKLLEESGFEISAICNPYPKSFNKWEDSRFKLYECKKQPRIKIHNDVLPSIHDKGARKVWNKTYNNVIKQKTLNKKESKQLLVKIYDHLTQAGVRPLVAFGTLLGIIREQDLISYDTDIDFIIREQDSEYLTNALLTLPKGYKLLRINPKGIGGDVLISMGNDTCYADIYIYISKSNDSDKYIPMFAGDYSIKKSDFDNPCSIQFLNKSFLTLNNYEKYLQQWYKDWKTPFKMHKKRF